MPPTALPLAHLLLEIVGLCVAVAAFFKGQSYVFSTTMLGLGGIRITLLAARALGRENLASPCIASMCAIALVWATVHYGRKTHWRTAVSLLWSLTWAALSATFGCAYWADYLDSSNHLLIKLATTLATGSWYIAQASIAATTIAIVMNLFPRNQPRRKPVS